MKAEKEYKHSNFLDNVITGFVTVTIVVGIPAAGIALWNLF